MLGVPPPPQQHVSKNEGFTHKRTLVAPALAPQTRALQEANDVIRYPDLGGGGWITSIPKP